MRIILDIGKLFLLPKITSTKIRQYWRDFVINRNKTASFSPFWEIFTANVEWNSPANRLFPESKELNLQIYRSKKHAFTHYL